jgi:hypothetical protein
MGTLRLLLALGLIALGTTGAAFAISGYFEPRQWPKEAKGSDAASKAKLEMGVLKPRQRFVAIEAKTKPAVPGAPSATPPSKAKATSDLAKAPAKKPPLAKDGSKDANVQQAAAWWPLANLFKN